MKVEAKPSSKSDIVITLSAAEAELFSLAHPPINTRWTYPETQLQQDIANRIREIYRLADE